MHRGAKRGRRTVLLPLHHDRATTGPSLWRGAGGWAESSGPERRLLRSPAPRTIGEVAPGVLPRRRFGNPRPGTGPRNRWRAAAHDRTGRGVQLRLPATGGRAGRRGQGDRGPVPRADRLEAAQARQGRHRRGGLHGLPDPRRGLRAAHRRSCSGIRRTSSTRHLVDPATAGLPTGPFGGGRAGST